MERSEALRRIAEAAVASERATGLPAELTAAQCILESGWLKKAPGNNCFGIKLARRHSMCQTFMTWEVENGQHVEKTAAFAAYPSLDDCFIDHALLITSGKPYAAAWAAYRADHDLDDLMQGVARKYATDPAYYRKIAKLAGRADVRDAIAKARAT